MRISLQFAHVHQGTVKRLELFEDGNTMRVYHNICAVSQKWWSLQAGGLCRWHAVILIFTVERGDPTRTAVGGFWAHKAPSEQSLWDTATVRHVRALQRRLPRGWFWALPPCLACFEQSSASVDLGFPLWKTGENEIRNLLPLLFSPGLHARIIGPEAECSTSLEKGNVDWEQVKKLGHRLPQAGVEAAGSLQPLSGSSGYRPVLPQQGAGSDPQLGD